MPYKVIADMVVIVHLLWIAFLLLGALPGARNRAVKYVHLWGLAFAVVIQVFGWYCPLTYLEVWLRGRHDPALAYPGSFMAHYAEELVYMDLSRKAVFALTTALIVINACVYLRKKGRPRQNPPALG
jgi:hypothetical protein